MSGSADRCGKHHFLSKIPPSLSARQNVHRSSADSSDKRLATSNRDSVYSSDSPKEREAFCGRSRDVGGTPVQNTGPGPTTLSLEAVSRIKKKLQEYKKKTLAKLQEDSRLSEREAQNRQSGVQERRTLVPSVRISDDTEGDNEMQNKKDEHSVIKKLSFESNHSNTSVSHEPPRSSPQGGTTCAQNGLHEGQSGDSQPSHVSIFYRSPSVSRELPILTPQKSTNAVNRTPDEAKGEENMQSKDSKNLTSGSNGRSGSNESPLSVSQGGRKQVQKIQSGFNSPDSQNSFVSAFYKSPSIFNDR